MTAAETAITTDPRLPQELDIQVRGERFKRRSHAIQAAVADKIRDLTENRLARECAKLDSKEEIAWAEMGLTVDLKSWPKY